MTLAAYFRLRSFVKERRLISDLGELIPIGGFLHDGVAINASDATPRVRTGFPVSLHSPLMTAKTRFVLDLCRFTRVFTERNHATDALAPSGSNMVAAGAVTALTSPLLCFVARVIEKNLSHLRLGKLLKLRNVTGFTDFV